MCYRRILKYTIFKENTLVQISGVDILPLHLYMDLTLFYQHLGKTKPPNPFPELNLEKLRLQQNGWYSSAYCPNYPHRRQDQLMLTMIHKDLLLENLSRRPPQYYQLTYNEVCFLTIQRQLASPRKINTGQQYCISTSLNPLLRYLTVRFATQIWRTRPGRMV